MQQLPFPPCRLSFCALFCVFTTVIGGCGDDDGCEGAMCVDAGDDVGVDTPVDVPEDIRQDTPTNDTSGSCGDCDGVCDGDRCLQSCRNGDDCGSRGACSPQLVDHDGDGTADHTATVCVELDRRANFPGFPCDTDTDCSTQTCFDGRCTEVCASDTDCFAGQTCQSVTEGQLGPYNACHYDPNPDAIERYDLMSAGPNNPVMVGPTATSIMFEATAGGSDVFSSALAQDRTNLFDLNDLFRDPNNPRDQPIRWLPGDRRDVANMLVSNTDRIDIAEGRYVFVPITDGGQGIETRAFVRHRPLGGTLRIRVHIAGGMELNASNAASSARLTATLSAFENIYSGAGINLEVVGYENISTNALWVIDSFEGPTSEVARLFETSPSNDGPILDVFLVRAFQGGALLGIAGGIPGPVLADGNMSGVALAFDQQVVGNGGELAGLILAHEVGHYLGLFHSTEQSAVLADGFDAIDDTAQNDRSNLMFFSVQSGAGGPNLDLTPGQNAVLGAHALVR